LNEEKGIKDTIDRISDSVKEHSEIIVVDGMSKDKTASVARKTGAKLITLSNRGKGLAMRTGAKAAKGNILVFLDGDGTYPSEDIPKFIENVKPNILVLGNATPFVKSRENILEKFKFLYPSFLISSFVFSKNGIHLQDPLNGMRSMMKDDFERLNLISIGFEIETEINLKALSLGMKTVEIPIRIFKRNGGRSKFFFNFRSHIKIIRLLRLKRAARHQ